MNNMKGVAEKGLEENIFCPIPKKGCFAHGYKRGLFILTELGLECLCPHCNEHWPLTTEFWALSSRNPRGVQGWCRGCASAWSNEKGKERRRLRGPLPKKPRKKPNRIYSRTDGKPVTRKLAEESGLTYGAVRYRRSIGWSDERIKATPQMCLKDASKRSHWRSL